MARRRKYSKKTPRYQALLPVVGGVLFLWLIAELVLLPRGDEFLHAPPVRTSLMIERIEEAKEKGRKGRIEYAWVPLKAISPQLVKAVLVAEDAKFLSHHGFDFEEIYHALKSSLMRMKLPRGASTITQQVAKNLYLSTSKSPLRKLREAILTRRLEARLSKRRILEIYLNIIEWGEGVFGVEAAATHYFGKSADKLSTDEAAFLAAIIPNPLTVYNPVRSSERVAARKKTILKLMEKSRILDSSIL